MATKTEVLELAEPWMCRELIGSDVKPDTNKYYFLVNHDESGKYKDGEIVAVDKQVAMYMKHSLYGKSKFTYHSPVYTKLYANQAYTAVDTYLTLQHKATNCLYDNPHYYDPNLKPAKEEWEKFVKKGVSEQYKRLSF